MKKILIALLAIIMLAGCGEKNAQPLNSSSAKASKQSASDDNKYTITEEELTACLVGQSFESKLKAVLISEVSESMTRKFIITKLTELNYTAGKGDFDNIIKINGTFQASGSAFIESEPLPSSEATAEPVNFSVTVYTDDKSKPTDFKVTKTILIKPVEPLDKENLIQYLDVRQSERIQHSPSVDRLIVSRAEPGGLNTTEKIDYTNPDLRIVVIDDPFPDDELFYKTYTVELYDGNEYLCTGRADTYINKYRYVILSDLEKLR